MCNLVEYALIINICNISINKIKANVLKLVYLAFGFLKSLWKTPNLQLQFEFINFTLSLIKTLINKMILSCKEKTQSQFFKEFYALLSMKNCKIKQFSNGLLFKIILKVVFFSNSLVKCRNVTMFGFLQKKLLIL